MKTALIVLLALSAAACGTVVGGPTGGYVTYDVLAQLQRDCAAKGGTLKQKTDGDPRWIDAWACERK